MRSLPGGGFDKRAVIVFLFGEERGACGGIFYFDDFINQSFFAKFPDEIGGYSLFRSDSVDLFFQ